MLIQYIKSRIWVIIILLVMALFLILSVLAHETQEEEREFRGTFIDMWWYDEYLYQAQTESKSI